MRSRILLWATLSTAAFACSSPSTTESSKPQGASTASQPHIVAYGHGTYVLSDRTKTHEPSDETILASQAAYLRELKAVNADDSTVLSEDIVANADALAALLSASTLKGQTVVRHTLRAMTRVHAQRAGLASVAQTFQALKTERSGMDYVEECRANGVPVPDVIADPEEGSGWRNHEVLETTILSNNLSAELWSYESTSPDGVCLALPRWNGADRAGLFGVICLGRVTNKVCFFDNPRGRAFPRNQGIDISEFVGGMDLDANGQGVCSDCHAGENPFVIHPYDPAFVSALSLDLMPAAWPEPIIPDAINWPENPGPLTTMPFVSPGQRRCNTCHAQGGAGRFPLVSELRSYCSTVLEGVLQPRGTRLFPGDPNTLAVETMPPGGNAAAHSEHIAWLRGLCNAGSGNGTTIEIDPGALQEVEFISKPIIVEPVYACARSIRVRGAALNAELHVIVDGNPLPVRIVRDPDKEEFNIPGGLVAPGTIEAFQVVDGRMSGVDTAPVRDHTADYPSGVLPAPAINPDTTHQCASTLAVTHINGAQVTVTKTSTSGSTTRKFWGSGGGYTWVSMGPEYLIGDEFKVTQSLCGNPESPSSPVVVARPAPASLPTVQLATDLIEGQELVSLNSLVEGAGPAIDAPWAGGTVWDMVSWPLSWHRNIDIASRTGGPLVAGQELLPWQQLCESQPGLHVVSEIPEEPPMTQPCESLPAPRVAPPISGTDYVVVIRSIPGAIIRVFDGSATEIGYGSGALISLARPLVAGETIIVVQQLTECFGSTAYAIPVSQGVDGGNDG